VLEDKPNEAVRISVRPLKREVAIDSEPLKPLNNEVCSTKAEDEPREPDKDLARPLFSDPVRPSEPVRDLSREM